LADPLLDARARREHGTQSYLDTRVAVKMGGKRGKVIIEFATLEDLERIYRRVTDQG